MQESYVAQDPSAPPSDTLLLPPLSSLYSVNTRNRELSQQAESRQIFSPTQHTPSRQIMKAWTPWSEVITSSQNSRMVEQLILLTPLTIDATKEQDLDPRSCSNIEHPFVVSHEMMVIEPGEKSSRNLGKTNVDYPHHVSFSRWQVTHDCMGVVVLINPGCPNSGLSRKSTVMRLPVFWYIRGSPPDIQSPICNTVHSWMVCLQDQLVDSLCWSPGKNPQGYVSRRQWMRWHWNW